MGETAFLSRVRRSCLTLNKPLLVFGRQLGTLNADAQLVEIAGEFERRLIVLIVDARLRIRTDVEGLVKLHNDRNRPIHLLRRYGVAIDFECAGAAASDTADI